MSEPEKMLTVDNAIAVTQRGQEQELTRALTQMTEKRMAYTVEIKTSGKRVSYHLRMRAWRRRYYFRKDRATKSAGVRPASSHIIDFHRLTAANVSTGFLNDFAEEKSIFNREARLIIVAPQPHIFGLARMTQILMESQSPNIEVLRSLD